MPNADSAQRRLRDPAHPGALALPGEHDECDVAGSARVGSVPAAAARPRSGSICSMSVVSGRAEVARASTAAQHEVCSSPRSAARRGALGVGDDPLDLAELGLARDVAVGTQQHGDGAEAAQRDDHGECARTRAHQHADVLSAPHADRDQAADDVVDPLVDVLGGCRRGPRTGRRRRPGCAGSVPATSSPSEIRVLGWICSSLASRGS